MTRRVQDFTIRIGSLWIDGPMDPLQASNNTRSVRTMATSPGVAPSKITAKVTSSISREGVVRFDQPRRPQPFVLGKDMAVEETHQEQTKNKGKEWQQSMLHHLLKASHHLYKHDSKLKPRSSSLHWSIIPWS